MKRLFTILFTWLALVLLLNGVIHVALEQGIATSDKSAAIPEESINSDHALYKVVKQAYGLAQDKQYLAALQLLEAKQTAFDDLVDNERKLLFEYYKLKGHCHAALWQHVEAEAMWHKAGEYASRNTDKKRIRDLIQMSVRAIDDMNQERDLKEEYHASPNVGPAAQLRGKVALIYVFLADKTFHEWSLRQRTHVLANWQLAQDWLTVKVNQYHSQVSFTQRVFLLDKHPLIKRLRVGDQSSNFENSDAVAMLAAGHFGYASISEFIEAIKQEENADQAVLIYHLARDGRSFASRCMHGCTEYGEFVFLMESPDVKQWQSLVYTQAHESLHLFGADDLYNIRKAKYYAVRDIMNYPASVLDASTMEDITAYAVGLSERKPVTPFKIKNYQHRR